MKTRGIGVTNSTRSRGSGRGLRRSQKADSKRTTGMLLIVFLFFFMACTTCAFAADKAEKWEGVDKAVVEKIAKEQGREAHAPLIDTEQGDLMLFLFLSAGAIGGFIAGYSYRALTERKTDTREKAA